MRTTDPTRGAEFIAANAVEDRPARMEGLGAAFKNRRSAGRATVSTLEALSSASESSDPTSKSILMDSVGVESEQINERAVQYRVCSRSHGVQSVSTVVSTRKHHTLFRSQLQQHSFSHVIMLTILSHIGEKPVELVEGMRPPNKARFFTAFLKCTADDRSPPTGTTTAPHFCSVIFDRNQSTVHSTLGVFLEHNLQ